MFAKQIGQSCLGLPGLVEVSVDHRGQMLIHVIQLLYLLLMLAHVVNSLLVGLAAVLLAARLNQCVDLGLHHLRHAHALVAADFITIIKPRWIEDGHPPLLGIEHGLPSAWEAAVGVVSARRHENALPREA